MQRSANRRYLPRRPGAVYVFADRAAAERWGTTSGGDAGRDVVLNAVETAMSVHAAKRAIPNAIIAISDVSGTRSPQRLSGTGLGATASCIVVSCRLEMDGETEIQVGLAGEIRPKAFLVFDDTLETPSRAIDVAT